MKADRSKFPALPADLPQGAQLNFDARRQVYYVFTEKMTNGVTKRTSIGSLYANGTFKYSKRYLQAQQIEALEKESKQLKRQLDAGAKKQSKAAKDQAKAASDRVDEALKQSNLDKRADNASIRINGIILLVALAMLARANDCEDIANFNQAHHAELVALFGNNAPPEVLHRETLRRILFLAEPQSMAEFISCMVKPILLESKNDELRVIAADGQACRATGRREAGAAKLRGVYYIMNLWDTNANVCVAQSVIPKKKNEISILPELLKGLDVCGAVITADALNTQKKTVDAILERKANYCLAVKDNQPTLYEQMRFRFTEAKSAQIWETAQTETTLEHGRIETRRVDVLPADCLGKDLLDEWTGLASGVIVRSITFSENKVTGEKSEDARYFICSLHFRSGIARKMLTVVRAHWKIEDKLHWMLDCHFDQDRMQASDVNFIANTSALRKLILTLLYQEQKRVELEEGVKISIKALRARCTNLAYALGVLARGLRVGSS